MTSDSTSYWQHTAPTVPLSTDLPLSVDVVVIGGGLMGTATSYWLAREGVSLCLVSCLSAAFQVMGCPLVCGWDNCSPKQ